VIIGCYAAAVSCVIGQVDGLIRQAAFDWLTDRREVLGESLPRTSLENEFLVAGTRVPLMGPQGIWKPAQCELPLSVTTVSDGPYADAFDSRSGVLRYAYRGTDTNHRDNRGLRKAGELRTPLIYFLGVGQARYAAAYPVFVVGDNPNALFFDLQVDDISASRLSPALAPNRIAEEAEPRRAYITTTAKRRLFQEVFRQRVLRAYREACALCRLRHPELLDAAHITPDADDAGDPFVSNGLALCKLHHAAFDKFFFTVRPDYRIQVRPSILTEVDGPMLIVGLQDIHGQLIQLPHRPEQRPDPARLEKRLVLFEVASSPTEVAPS
jgi:putative restriction endonuclease